MPSWCGLRGKSSANGATIKKKKKMASVAPREVEICGEVSKNFFGMDSDGNIILDVS